MPTRFSPPRWLLPLAAGLLLLGGCEKDEIRSYTVPKPTPESFESKVRLLAAVFESGKDQWFFKLVGPVEEVDKREEAFLAFVNSVHFTGKVDALVEWKVPASWEKGPPSELRYATFFTGKKGKAPEVSVFKFDRQSSLLDNVNRWCRLDLGRRPMREAELDEVKKTLRVGDQVGTLIDLKGPGAREGSKGAPPMMDRSGNVRRPPALAIKYAVPEGWRETGPRISERGGISVRIYTAFDVDESKKAEVTVQVFPAAFGNWSMNVNRWRGDVGLAPLPPGQAAKEKNKLSVAGIDSPYLDLEGAQKRSLVVVVTRGQQAWFFKLLGDKDVVSANKNKFESFVKSVQFTGAADE
jgi:hypothetical protein